MIRRGPIADQQLRGPAGVPVLSPIRVVVPGSGVLLVFGVVRVVSPFSSVFTAAAGVTVNGVLVSGTEHLFGVNAEFDSRAVVVHEVTPVVGMLIGFQVRLISVADPPIVVTVNQASLVVTGPGFVGE